MPSTCSVFNAHPIHPHSTDIAYFLSCIGTSIRSIHLFRKNKSKYIYSLDALKHKRPKVHFFLFCLICRSGFCCFSYGLVNVRTIFFLLFFLFSFATAELLFIRHNRHKTEKTFLYYFVRLLKQTIPMKTHTGAADKNKKGNLTKTTKKENSALKKKQRPKFHCLLGE